MFPIIQYRMKQSEGQRVLAHGEFPYTRQFQHAMQGITAAGVSRGLWAKLTLGAGLSLAAEQVRRVKVLTAYKDGDLPPLW